MPIAPKYPTLRIADQTPLARGFVRELAAAGVEKLSASQQEVVDTLNAHWRTAFAARIATLARGVRS